MDIEDDEPVEVTDDYPFEGAKTMSLTIQLGLLTINWPRHEGALFDLFSVLCGAPRERAEIIWTTLVSLDIRLRIMRQLAQRLDPDPVREAVTKAIDAAKAFAERRNRMTHWTWTHEDGDWRLASQRDKNRPAIKVDSWEVKRLTDDLALSEEVLFVLCAKLKERDYWRPSPTDPKGIVT